jgi:hypothetical protein
LLRRAREAEAAAEREPALVRQAVLPAESRAERPVEVRVEALVPLVALAADVVLPPKYLR